MSCPTHLEGNRLRRQAPSQSLFADETGWTVAPKCHKVGFRAPIQGASLLYFPIGGYLGSVSCLGRSGDSPSWKVSLREMEAAPAQLPPLNWRRRRWHLPKVQRKSSPARPLPRWSLCPLGVGGKSQAIRDVTRRPRPVRGDLGAWKIQLVQLQLRPIQRQAREPRDRPTTTRGLQRPGIQDGQARRCHRPQRARPARAHLPRPRAPLTARARLRPGQAGARHGLGGGGCDHRGPPRTTQSDGRELRDGGGGGGGAWVPEVPPAGPALSAPTGGHFRSWGITTEFRVQIVGLPRRPSMCVEDARGYSW